MNEIKTIHLGRQPFTITIEAHKELQNYLEAIERQVGSDSEVVKEVEMRMAELLTEHGIKHEKVILLEDVHFLKEQLGEPHDFKDEGGEEQSGTKAKAKEVEGPKQLYRDPEHGLIAGVAAGVAAYFSIDVLIVRVLFVVLSFASGAGIVLYILLWILAPEVKTSSDRLKMRGKAVTVNSIKTAVDRADIAGAAQRAGTTMGTFMEKSFKGISTTILGIFGILLIIAGAAIVLGTMTAGLMMVIRGFQIANEKMFPLDFRDHVLLVSAVIAAIIAGVFFMLIGVAMIRRKWKVPGWVVASMIGLLFAGLSVGAAFGFDAFSRVHKRYEAAHHTQTRSLTAFTKLHIDGKDVPFVFQPSNEYSVDLSYIGKLNQDLITTTVEGGVLKIDTSKLDVHSSCNLACMYDYADYDVRATVHAPSLEHVTLTGSGASFTTNETLRQDRITIEAANDTFVRLMYMHPKNVVLDLVGQKNNVRKVEIDGLQSDATSQDQIRLAEAFDGSAWIDRPDSIAIKTDSSCEDGGYEVGIGNQPLEIRLNDHIFKTREELRSNYNSDVRNVFNCVLVQ